MIKRYCLGRKEIISLILRAPKTKDGYLYFPRFDKLNMLDGTYSEDYYYSREIFKNKVYFSKFDIKLYLSRNKIEGFIEDDYITINLKFNEIFKDIIHLDVDDIVPGFKYSAGDVIDIFEFKYQYLNNNI